MAGSAVRVSDAACAADSRKDGPMADEKIVTFHYLKSELFRECHCDGIYGGMTPNGGLWISFFSERSPVPREAVHKALAMPGMGEGTVGVGELIKDKSKMRDGIIRTLESGVFMTLETAEALHKWLEGHIVEIKKRRHA